MGEEVIKMEVVSTEKELCNRQVFIFQKDPIIGAQIH